MQGKSEKNAKKVCFYKKYGKKNKDRHDRQS